MAAPRYSPSAFLLLALASLIGCNPEPATLRTAKPAELPPAGAAEWKPPARPAQSSPEAQKKLQALLAAHTGGKPELLAKLKNCTFIRNGAIVVHGPPGYAATQAVDLAWPARFKHTTELTAAAITTNAVGLTPDGNWLAEGSRPLGEAAPPALPKKKLTEEVLAMAQRQMQEDACFLLFPYADPLTRVQVADDAKIGERDCFGLHLWTPALACVMLHVDKKTNTMARMTFLGYETGHDVLKVLLFDNLQDFGGVKLPAKVYLRAGSFDIAEWRSLKVASGKTFDSKFFDNP